MRRGSFIKSLIGIIPAIKTIGELKKGNVKIDEKKENEYLDCSGMCSYNPGKIKSVIFIPKDHALPK